MTDKQTKIFVDLTMAISYDKAKENLSNFLERYGHLLNDKQQKNILDILTTLIYKREDEFYITLTNNNII